MSKQGRVVGVDTQMGLRFRGGAVVLTTGTFLGGRIHIGWKTTRVVAPGMRLPIRWRSVCGRCRSESTG